MIPLLINIVGFYLGWFACVLGAAHGLMALGPVVVFLLLILHLKLHRPWQAELLLAWISFFMGFIIDSVLVTAGVMVLKRDFMPEGVTTFWMMCMWVNFALTLNVALKCLYGHPWFAALLGALGGPAAYYTGERLGAISIPDPFWLHLVIIGVAWGGVTPLLVETARKLKLRFTPSSGPVKADPPYKNEKDFNADPIDLTCRPGRDVSSTSALHDSRTPEGVSSERTQQERRPKGNVGPEENPPQACVDSEATHPKKQPKGDKK